MEDQAFVRLVETLRRDRKELRGRSLDELLRLPLKRIDQFRSIRFDISVCLRSCCVSIYHRNIDICLRLSICVRSPTMHIPIGKTKIFIIYYLF